MSWWSPEVEETLTTAPPPRAFMCGCTRLERYQGAQVHAQHLLPLLEGHTVDLLGRWKEAGIVDQDVPAAQPLHHAADQPLEIGRFRPHPRPPPGSGSREGGIPPPVGASPRRGPSGPRRRRRPPAPSSPSFILASGSWFDFERTKPIDRSIACQRSSRHQSAELPFPPWPPRRSMPGARSPRCSSPQLASGAERWRSTSALDASVIIASEFGVSSSNARMRFRQHEDGWPGVGAIPECPCSSFPRLLD